MSSFASTGRLLVGFLGIAIVLALALLAMGREPWCECGTIKLWHGVVRSSENSQHLTDWYTFTHVLHGFGFYAALALAGRRLPLGTRFLLAMAGEAAWEAFENTSFVIERYRAETISLDYYGDSVVNALGDLLATAAGFVFAARAPVWATVAALLALEGLLAWFIRDNLTLNILMLLWPIEAIQAWQAGA
ncbi:MAG TPA: DUF2585 family protein [Myxococcota bacterium]|nr:DUF2585 family protein [Myxococcota bacterium]